MDLTVGVSSDGAACTWWVLVEDRVTLLNRVELTTGVLNERSARVRGPLLEGEAVVFFLTAADCVSLSYQHWPLTNEERRGRGDLRFARFWLVAEVRLGAMLSGGRGVQTPCEAVDDYMYILAAPAQGERRMVLG